MEETTGSIFSQKEIKILEAHKNTKSLKIFKGFYLVFSFIFAFLIINGLYNLVTNFSGNILIFVLPLIFDVIFMFISLSKFLQYDILLQKLKIINNIESNYLVDICQEKIERCQKLIDNNESYYVVHEHYNDLREFLENYRNLLPIEIYTQAKKDLDAIATELVHCN